MIAPHPAVLSALVAIGAAGSPPEPAALARDVLALAASGDPARLARAAEAVPEAFRVDPGYRGAAAARAIACLLSAADLREVSAASPEGAPGLRKARAVQEAALEELRGLVQQAPEDPDVLRALAVYYGLDGRPGETARLVAAAGASGIAADDPWLDLATLVAGLRGLPVAEAEQVLASFVAGHRGAIPPRMSLARARIALGDRDRAVAALDDLLALDPDHDAARVLKASLLAPPPLEPIAPSVPSSAPPRTAPGFLPRKKAATGRTPAFPPST